MSLEDLGGLIKSLESQPSWQAQRQFRLVMQHWPKVVGFAVARKTRPVSIQRSTLYVATATAVWAQTLSYERIKILQKLNRYQPQPLKAIRFSTAQWVQAPAQSLSDMQPVKAHPSYIDPAYLPPSIVTSEELSTPALPQTPEEAFSRWESKVKQLQIAQSICPRCRCHCPQGEIDRWSICSLCAVKEMR